MRKLKFTNKQAREMVALYKNGVGSTKIAHKYGLCIPTVIKFLRSKNIEIIGTKRYNCFESFFENIDTEEKAYWLGFLYADGSVRIRDKKYYEVKLKLSARDKEHVEKFKRAIRATNNVRISTEKYKYKNKSKIVKVAWIAIYEKKLAIDLINKGCIPCKSLKIEFPYWLNKKLIRHFIRGYFDGDGSVYYEHPIRDIYICSGSKKFIKKLQDELNTIVSSTRLEKRNNNLFMLHFPVNKNDRSIINTFLYKDASIFLERKKQIMNKLISL